MSVCSPLYVTKCSKYKIGKVGGLQSQEFTRSLIKNILVNKLHQVISGFGGLEVACWPLVPKFAGSHPAKAVGFLGRKNSLHSFLRREVKPSVPCRSFTACKRSLNVTRKSAFRQNSRTFSSTVPPSAAGCSRVVTRVETPGGES